MKVDIGPFVQKGKRKINVKIHSYDVWNADQTIAMIVLPILKKYKKESRCAYPCSIMTKEHLNFDSNKKFFKEKKNGPLHKKLNKIQTEAQNRWDNILDKMIWSFNEILNDNKYHYYFKNKKIDKKKYEEYRNKMEEGLNLFAKHLTDLWT